MATTITNTIGPIPINPIVKNKSRDFLINLSLLSLSITFAFLLCEVALRITGQGPLYVSPERSRFWRYDSLLGWAHQPGQEGIFETPQFSTFVRINQKGLRDPEHSYERQNDSGRILVLGDSFAWGYGVEESERFSQLLEKSLDAEVINAGVSGYSTDQELLWFKDEGIQYDFDLVILVFTGNDIGDNERNLVHTIYYKPRFVQEDGQLILTGSPVPRAGAKGRFIYSASQQSAFAYFLANKYYALKDSYGRYKADMDQGALAPGSNGAEGESFGLTMAMLEEMENLAGSRGAEFMVVATDSWWNNPSEETYQDFIDRVQTEGFLVLDVQSTAGFAPGEMLIPDDGHWNAAGNGFVAEEVRNFIESHQLLNQP